MLRRLGLAAVFIFSVPLAGATTPGTGFEASFELLGAPDVGQSVELVVSVNAASYWRDRNVTLLTPAWVDVAPARTMTLGSEAETQDLRWTLTATREGFWVASVSMGNVGDCCLYAHSAARDSSWLAGYDASALLPSIRAAGRIACEIVDARTVRLVGEAAPVGDWPDGVALRLSMNFEQGAEATGTLFPVRTEMVLPMAGDGNMSYWGGLRMSARFVFGGEGNDHVVWRPVGEGPYDGVTRRGDVVFFDDGAPCSTTIDWSEAADGGPTDSTAARDEQDEEGEIDDRLQELLPFPGIGTAMALVALAAARRRR